MFIDPRALTFVVPALVLVGCAVGTQGADPPLDGGALDGGPEGDGSDGTDAGLDARLGSDTGPRDAAGTDARPFDSAAPCTAPASGALVTYGLVGQPGNQTTTAATSSATGVTASPLARSPGLTATTATDSMNASGWATGASADSSLYYTFTVTPASGCTLSLTSLALDVKASSTGPANADVAVSVGNFAPHTASFAATSTPTVALTGATASGPIEIRIYGYGAASAGGTLRLQNTVTVSGTLN